MRITKRIAARLTVDIVDASLSGQFDQARAELIAVSDAIYDDVHDGNLKAAMESLTELSEGNGFAPFSGWDAAYLNVGGMTLNLGFSSKRPALVSYGVNSPYMSPAFPPRDGSDALGKRLVAAHERMEELKARRADLTDSTKATILSFPSVEKLREGWPEIAPFIDHLLPDAPKNLPAVRVVELNAQLGLPLTTEELEEAA